MLVITCACSRNWLYSSFITHSTGFSRFAALLIIEVIVAFLGNLAAFSSGLISFTSSLIISSMSCLSRMVKDVSYPRRCALLRKTLCASEWNVPPATFLHLSSERLAALSSISPEAFRVKVKRSMFSGGMPDSTSLATRYTSVRVFPLPAPAITCRGPLRVMTASSCAGLRTSLYLILFSKD